MIRVISYGKSMYGGWYVSYLEKQDNDYKGKHYKTLKALKDDIENLSLFWKAKTQMKKQKIILMGISSKNINKVYGNAKVRL